MKKNQTQSAKTKNQPVHEVRLGLIKGVIWTNPTKSNGIMHNVTLARIYRDTEGHWQETQSLGRDDLLAAAKVLDLAHTWIFENARNAAA